MTMANKGLLIVISGPSGAGKGTICNELIKRDGFYLSVSATTRLPRKGEAEGVNYYFLSKEDFTKKIERNDFLNMLRFTEIITVLRRQKYSRCLIKAKMSY